MASQAMTVRLPGDLHAKLRWQSFDTGTSMSQIIIDALAAHLPDDDAMFDAMTRRAVARNEPALRDLAEQ